MIVVLDTVCGVERRCSWVRRLVFSGIRREKTHFVRRRRIEFETCFHTTTFEIDFFFGELTRDEEVTGQEQKKDALTTEEFVRDD